MRETNPPLDVYTRFNCTYFLLKWVNENDVPISLPLIKCRQLKNVVDPTPTLPEGHEDTLQNGLKLLKYTTEASTVQEGDSYVSISLITPYITEMLQQLNTTVMTGCSAFRLELVKQLCQRFDLTDPRLRVATFLDPRFKVTYLHEYVVDEIEVWISDYLTRNYSEMINNRANIQQSDKSKEQDKR